MAGGFMAGFGSAFADSFNAARERSAKREDDIFKIRFDQYTKQLEKVQETKAEQAKRVRQAKALVERTGVDPNMWPKIYDQLESSSESAVEKWLTENEFTIKQADPAQPQTADDPSATNLPQAASGAVDSQMSAAGMGVPPPKKGEGLFAGVENASGIDLFSSTDENVMNRMTRTTGQTPEQIKATMEDDGTTEAIAGTSDLQVSWKPKVKETDREATSIEEAGSKLIIAKQSGDPVRIKQAQEIYDNQIAIVHIKAYEEAKANGTYREPTIAAIRNEEGFVGYAEKRGDQWVDPSTGEVVQEKNLKVFNDAMMKDLEKIKEETKEPVFEYTTKAENLGSMIILGQEMQEIAVRSPGAATYAGQFARYIDANARGISELLNTFANKSAASGEYTMEGLAAVSEQEQTLADYVRTFTGQGIEKLALDAALLDAKATRMAYAYGVAQGQEGRSIVQEEFNNFKRDALGGGNPDIMLKGTAEFVLGEYAKLKMTESNLNKNNASIRFFETQHKVPSPFKPAADLDSLLESNPLIMQGLKKYKMIGSTGGVQTTGTTTDGGGATQIKSVDEYNQLPPGAKYIDPNGVPRIKGQK